MSVLYEDSLVIAVVSEARKEDATRKQGHLERLDVDIDSEPMPCVGPYGPRNDGGEDPVKVQQGEHGSYGRQQRHWSTSRDKHVQNTAGNEDAKERPGRLRSQNPANLASGKARWGVSTYALNPGPGPPKKPLLDMLSGRSRLSSSTTATLLAPEIASQAVLHAVAQGERARKDGR